MLVEDDDDLREAVADTLRRDGYEVRGVAAGSAVDEVVDGFRPDVAILDVSLPGAVDGFTIARGLRARTDIPIVFLTAVGDEAHRLEGFAAGADDYLVKPFPMAELLVRLRAILRRTNQLGRWIWRVGDIVIDEDAHTVVVADRPVELTALEFDLLVALARHPGRVMSKVQLLNAVWGFDHYSLNLVEVHISALRKKLEAYGPRVIHTVRNVGYVLRGQ